MQRCDRCNTPAPWCWLGASGRCDWLAEAHWALHNAARSPIGPPEVESITTPEQTLDPAEAARLRREQKPRVPLGCGPCHGKVEPPAEPDPPT